MDKYVKVPLSDEDARSLKSGDYVYLTGPCLVLHSLAMAYAMY